MDDTHREQVAFEWGLQAARKASGKGTRGSGQAPGHAEGVERQERVGEPVRPPPLPPDNELWDVHAAARFLKRSVSWVYHKAEDGTLPVRRLGGWGLRFIPGELRAWVESGGARRTPR